MNVARPFQTQVLQQIDYRFRKQKNLYGCFVASIRRIVEEETERAFTVAENHHLITRLLREGAINANMALHRGDSHEHCLNAALDIGGLWRKGYRGTYVARLEESGEKTIRDRDLYSDRESKPGFYWIDEWQVAGAQSHFMNARADGTIWWDPHPGLELEHRISRRLFHVARR
jgi:hypothetical protein